MSTDRLYSLLAKKITHEASGEELEELQRLLDENPQQQLLEEVVNSLHQTRTTFLQFADDEQIIQSGWQSIHNQILAPGAPAVMKFCRIRHSWWKGMAAVALLLLGVVALWKWMSPQPLWQRGYHNQISTRPGSKSRIQLPDGSLVWLNVGSKLTYADGFSGGRRELTLEGEAFFDVVKDPAHPFVIHTQKMDVKVLGTSFNVKAYPEDATTEATLFRGRIEVTLLRHHEQKKIILAPRQKLVVNNQLSKFMDKDLREKGLVEERDNIQIQAIESTLKGDSAYTEISWIYNRLEFKKESFAGVMRKMERWYDVQINIEDSSLNNEIISGSLSAENIDKALEALQFTTHFRYEKTPECILIRR